MPAYNHAEYVRAAVDSVLAQTYGNFELIAIDDASNDDTWAALQSFADPRIKLVRHETNRGAHTTLNEALALASGAFVTIINSDDVYAPERLATCLDGLLAADADMLGTDIVLIDGSGTQISEHWWIRAFAELKQVFQETGDWKATLLEGNVFITTSNCFFRRGWFDAVGNFSDLRYVLDYEWLLRGIVKGQRLAWLDSPLLNYRLHESNTISERPLAANLECSRMLRQQLPELLGQDPVHKIRLVHLASQWARIEKYLGEIAATQRHEALVAKENELFRLIDERDHWVRERDQWIAERDLAIEECRHRIAERDGWIVERDTWITERDARIVATTRAFDASQAQLARLTNGLSFRIGRAITAPGRWLKSVLSVDRSGS